jgi:hypothetical protein
MWAVVNTVMNLQVPEWNLFVSTHSSGKGRGKLVQTRMFTVPLQLQK